MSALGQFDAGYNEQEDRILLRITNLDSDEYRLWLTRRMCFSLLTEFKTKTSAYRLTGTVATSASDVQSSASTAVLQAELEQKAVAAHNNYANTFKPGTQFPLGEKGLLVEEVNLKPHSKGQGVHDLSFHDANGKGITLAVTVDLFNSIFEVVERIAETTDWGIPQTSASVNTGSLLQ